MPSAVSATTVDVSIESNGYSSLPAVTSVQDTAIEQHGNTDRSTVIQYSASGFPASALTSPQESLEDLICIGFGPASLAIAIALHDSNTSSSPLSSRPKVTFLEKQPKFSWHSGMQLPGAKMQISFLKDLATPRNPQSHFTFINYLQSQNRLHNFINLGTFLPTRLEYEDYLRWCAKFFEAAEAVRYGQEVLDVSPVLPPKSASGRMENEKVTHFCVTSRDVKTGTITCRFARHVVIAVGGKGYVPATLPSAHPAVIHSSQYSMRVASALPDASKAYNIAIIGNGQSAAEIFDDLPSRYPNACVTLIIKGSALRPSDDSPFVNEVFNPDRVDEIFAQGEEEREMGISRDKATNYGVVRLEMLDHLYERLYLQRLQTPREEAWKIQIKPNRQLFSTQTVIDENSNGRREKLRLQFQQVVRNVANDDDGKAHSSSKHADADAKEELIVDAVFVATGYVRNAHRHMLKDTRSLLPASYQQHEGIGARFPVRRDYKIDFDPKKVAENAGVWLQGCNERTHGLSDTLLSILAIRSGELVKSIFGDRVDVEAGLRSKL